MLTKNWFGFALAIVLVALIYLFFAEFEPVYEAEETAQTPQENQPTAFARGVKTKKFRTDGGLEFYFEAETAEYFQIDSNQASPDDYALFDAPSAILFEPESSQGNTATWHVTAAAGKSTNDFKRVELSAGVEIWKPETEDSIAKVTTSHLTLETDTQYVHTNAPVELQLSHSISHSDAGMQAQLKQEQFKLFEVRTVHEPQQP